ncbi:hypothetical protein Hanom_Chr06g00496561 [Helianthus anomalus]
MESSNQKSRPTPFANFPELKSLSMADYSRRVVRCHSGAHKPPRNNQTCRFELDAPPSISNQELGVLFPLQNSHA